MTRKIRRVAPLAVALVVLTTSAALAAVTWSNPNPGSANPGRLGPNFTWNNGDPVLAVNGSIVEAAFVSDYVKGVFADDVNGPYMSVFFTRSTNGGATWEKAIKLNGAFHADRITIAGVGTNVTAFYMSQVHYWATPGGSTFKTSEPRYIYYQTSTTNGSAGSFSTRAKLPGQTKTSRGDYLYSAASGSDVYVVTTNTANGNISLWQSHDSGGTFTGPTTVGTTTATDLTSGYVGGYSGLPAVAATGSNVVVSYVATAAGRVDAKISTNSGTSFGTATVLAASGGNANNGYVQADGHDTRLVVSWTTAAGAFLRVYDTGGATWGAQRTIVTFPDSGGGIGTNNQGGEGAIPLLTGTTGISISLSECNTTTASTCNTPALDDVKTREALVYYSSTDNGATFPTRSVIAVPSSAKGTYIANYGDLALVAGKPFVTWNWHNSAYTDYTDQIRVGSGL